MLPPSTRTPVDQNQVVFSVLCIHEISTVAVNQQARVSLYYVTSHEKVMLYVNQLKPICLLRVHICVPMNVLLPFTPLARIIPHVLFENFNLRHVI